MNKFNRRNAKGFKTVENLRGFAQRFSAFSSRVEVEYTFFGRVVNYGPFNGIRLITEANGRFHLGDMV